MGEGKKDCRGEARVVFEKLNSWREESNRQFSDIINSHSSSIDRGITDLVSEVSCLQDKLSVTRKERNVLLGTVANLNGEIRQLNAKLIMGLFMAQPLSEPDENIDQNIQEDYMVEVPVKFEQGIERPTILLESDSEEMCTDYEDIACQNDQDQN